MKIRTAKPRDAKRLAKLHVICSEKQVDSFMGQLGINFLIKYYKILLNEKNSLVLLVEDEHGQLLGFLSGTFKAEEHLKALKDKRYQLFLRLIPKLIMSPKLINELFLRKKYVDGKSVKAYGIQQGPRAEYWAWHPNAKNQAFSIILQKTWAETMKLLGYGSFKLEVDVANENVIRIFNSLGYKKVDEYDLADGRRRRIYEAS